MAPFAHNEPLGSIASSDRFSRRLLLIGWQGAESKVVRTLLKSGRIPYLSSLLEQGAQVELAVPRPTNAVSAWTSLATGTRPHEHGILHALVPISDGRGLEPVSYRSRRRPTIWNMLNAAGLKSHIIGWPVSFPAEHVAGVCFSDQIATVANSSVRDSLEDSWVSPRELQPILRSRFVAPSQVDEITVGQMIPRAAKGLSVYPQLVAGCRSILAETATYFRILRWCLSKRPWDFATCVFPGLRRAHELALWLERVAPESGDCATELVAGCYEHHDLLLGQLLQQNNETHLIALALGSDGTGGEAAPGIAAVAGPAVRPSAGTTRRSVLDLAPTVLAMLGVPVPAVLPGRPWIDLFERTLEFRTIAADNSQLFDAKRDSTRPIDFTTREVADPSVEHLRGLGYVDPREVAANESVRICDWTNRLQSVISHLDAGLVDEAIFELESLIEQQPNSHQARAIFADALFRANRRQEARRQIEWLRYHGNEQPQVYRLSAAIELADRNLDAALVELQGTRRGAAKCSGADALEGDVRLRRREIESSRAAYQTAIDREGPTRAALTGLAAAELHSGRYEAAAMCALDALSTDMHYGRAHYYLAAALLQLEKPKEAIQALEAWAAVEPSAAAPYRWLARVYEQQLHDANRARDCRRRGREIVRQRRSISSPPMDGTSRLSSSR